MKKICLGLFLLFFPLFVFASDENINKIFKIEGYNYNELRKSFELEQYGSAVYVENNIVYTNAHVIFGEDDIPLENYRVCKTTNFKEKPICFSVGELLYYDKKNDLAALKIISPGVTPVTMSKKELNIGDVVKVYGYPSNGGETITYTEGKISGFENGLYKIDANIDSGNSGGGVFDKNGNLIGMAVSVKVGYTTLGYIIPLSKIHDFKSKKGTIVVNKKSTNKEFLNYSKLLQVVYGSKNFNNSEIEIKNIEKYGYHIHQYFVDTDRKMYFLSLIDDEQNNYITITNQTYEGKDYSTMDLIYKDSIQSAKKGKENKLIISSKIKKMKFQQNNAIMEFSVGKEKMANFSLIIEKSPHHIIKINILSKDINDPIFVKGVTMLLKGTNIKDTILSSESKNETLKLNNLVFKKEGGFYVAHSLGGNKVFHGGDDIRLYSLDFQIEKENTGTVLSEVIDGQYSFFKEYIYMNNFEIRTTETGLHYAYLFALNNETKEDDKIEKDEDRYLISAIFYTEEKDGFVYMNSINFTFNDLKSKETIDAFLKTISAPNGKNIEIGEMKLNENLIKSPEFDGNGPIKKDQ